MTCGLIFQVLLKTADIIPLCTVPLRFIKITNRASYKEFCLQILILHHQSIVDSHVLLCWVPEVSFSRAVNTRDRSEADDCRPKADATSGSQYRFYSKCY